jgi:hypothetical protein
MATFNARKAKLQNAVSVKTTYTTVIGDKVTLKGAVNVRTDEGIALLALRQASKFNVNEVGKAAGASDLAGKQKEQTVMTGAGFANYVRDLREAIFRGDEITTTDPVAPSAPPSSETVPPVIAERSNPVPEAPPGATPHLVAALDSMRQREKNGKR